MEQVDITIIGAGVIGLAVAARLSKSGQNILVVEKNPSFGQETSSRNSEVIHAGIYYPKDSLKAKTCLEGKELLYIFCTQNKIPHKKIGKLIVATKKEEIPDLQGLLENGLASGVTDLKILSQKETKSLEPNIDCLQAIYSPSTGILDTHSFMKALLFQFESQAGMIAYNTQVTAIGKVKDGFEIFVQDTREGNFEFFSRFVINCAGLNSDQVAAMSGIVKDEYKIKYCKGDYFRVHNNKVKYINHLVYPVPRVKGAGLGVHATLDLAGGMRLGPDDNYIEKIDYNIDASKSKEFYESAKEFLPFIGIDDLSADTCGIRPKLQGQGQDFRDFIIQNEPDYGLPGLINLIGIESPGITSSLSIAKKVNNILAKIF